jgi:hypothetical protein
MLCATLRTCIKGRKSDGHAKAVFILTQLAGACSTTHFGSHLA